MESGALQTGQGGATLFRHSPEKATSFHARARYDQAQDLREKPSIRRILDQTQHTSRANDAALATWLIEFLRSAERWNADEATRVAGTAGVDFATDWDRETCIDELARCYDLLPEDLRKIRGQYLPGLRPQNLPALLKEM
jgi:hypothetical protein